jgi:WD40 repeat protein
MTVPDELSILKE